MNRRVKIINGMEKKKRKKKRPCNTSNSTPTGADFQAGFPDNGEKSANKRRATARLSMERSRHLPNKTAPLFSL